MALLACGCLAARRAPPFPLQSKETPDAPAGLVSRLRDLATSFGGEVGVSIRAVEAGWTASVSGRRLVPQQSVTKLWTALAVLDAVDHGRLAETRLVRLTAADMSVFHQPLRDRLVNGAVIVSVGDLLQGALAQSDNACDDVLIRLLGGPSAVQRTLNAKGLGAIRSGPLERDLQCAISGLTWRPEYADRLVFEAARTDVPLPERRTRLRRYLADPPDGATADDLTAALARLARGELLSPASTARMVSVLTATTTGPMRLKAGLPAGWSLAHKTGTGQDLEAISTGFNDVGVATAPDGARYAVAIMIASTLRSIPERQAFMQAVGAALGAERQAETDKRGSRLGAAIP